MNKHLRNVLDNTAAVIGGIHGMNRDVAGPGADRFIPILAAVTPAVFATFALGEVGMWVLGEIGRQMRIREKRPDSPSLRGKPTPAELEKEWAAEPRSLGTCLRLGSRLADLDPTLDRSLQYTTLPSGKKLIRSRKGGMKGWLADHRVNIGYSTAMRYKKLVQRLRQVLGLAERLPLEWVMDGVPADRHLPEGLEASFAAARRQLVGLLRENRSLADLTRLVDRKLGIERLVVVRKMRPGRRGLHGKSRKQRTFSVISQHHRANISPARLDATKKAMVRILEAENPVGPALHLQNRLKAWLGGVGAVT